jgi:hypothetical protein
MGIEAAVEADHQRGLGLVDDLQAVAHPGDAEIDRLFAEDRLAGAGKFFDETGMGVGRGADDHGVDVLRPGDVVDAAHLGPVGRGDIPGRLGQGVGHRHQPGIRVAADRAGVNLADTARAEKTEAYAHG